MKITTLSVDTVNLEGQHGNCQWAGTCFGGSFDADEIAYLSSVIDAARESAPDPFRARTIDRLHNVLNGKVG